MGGTEKHLTDLIERLDPSAFDIVIVTMGKDPYTGFVDRSPGRRVRVVPGPRRGMAAAWRAFRALRPDVIVFTLGAFAQFHWNVYVAARLSGARRVAVIEHSMAPPPHTVTFRVALRAGDGRWSALVRWVTGPLRRSVTTRLAGLVSDATVCVSDAVRDRLVRDYGYPAGKTLTRHNGVDVRHFARAGTRWVVPDILAGRKGPIAVCVAHLVPPKRFDLLVHAMRDVSTRHPGSCCVLVGQGPLEEAIRSLVSDLGVEKSVLFAGAAGDVRPYLAAADLFVLSSDREGLPLVLLEAMSFGLPCVVSDVGGAREAVRNGVNGFVVPPGSAPALAEAISRLFASPDLRARMGESSRRIAEEEFEIEGSMAAVGSAVLGEEFRARRAG
jgi:glycosyltransferase involved in cell wall biosynthesis